MRKEYGFKAFKNYPPHSHEPVVDEYGYRDPSAIEKMRLLKSIDRKKKMKKWLNKAVAVAVVLAILAIILLSLGV